MERVRSAVEDLAGWTWDHLAEPVLTAEPITVLTLLFVLGVRVVERRAGWFGLQPVRRARRRARGDASLTDGARAALRETQALLVRRLRHDLTTATSRDVAAIAHQICAPQPAADPRAQPRPYDTDRFAALVALCAHALEPEVPGLIVRYLVRGSWEEYRELLERLAGYLGTFDHLRPVASRPLATGTTFAEAVSALSGALVAADLATGSARAAERVAVWHTGWWDGRPPQDTTAPTAYLRALRDRPSMPQVGSYNGRVPTLIGAEVRQSPGSDGAILVLVTGESDYAGTEPKPTGNDQSAPQCKKLLPARHDPALRRFRPLPAVEGEDEQPRFPIGGAFDPVDGVARSAQLNVKVGLISYHGGRPHLVLMRRTDSVSNARGTLAPTAGGVVELPVHGDPRDSDGLGSVDFLAAGRREMAEELGLRPEQYSLGVHAVFLSNNRTRPTKASQRSDLETGELVATVLGIGTTQLGPADFAAARTWASPGTGLYESHGVVFVPMGSSAVEFAGHVRRFADAMEQPTLVTALYASAHVFGPGPTVAAFRDAAAGTPWWAQPWPGATPGAASRVCRDPEDLLAPHERGGFAAWAAALGLDGWPRLLGTLTTDAEHWSQEISAPDATGPAAGA